MFCSKCGKEMADDAALCPFCGANLGAAPGQAQQVPPPYTQVPPPYNYQTAPPYQAPYYQQQSPPPEPDVPNTGMNVLSCFFPIVGIIFYFVWKDQTPLKAKALLKWAIAGLVISFAVAAVTIVLSIVLPLVLFGAVYDSGSYDYDTFMSAMALLR
ncbi:MAG: zinc ribbon domain-containing protein [Oscillospiraceae bacterium]|jgi:hypothetical protein|nr:zinc ribbon domain-containing protein [Oscillospiraceae bacterium]